MSRDGRSRSPLLDARNLCVDVGCARVLENVSISARPGDVVVLLGRFGAGKTTLLRTLCGALAPSTGSLSYDGGTPSTRRCAYYESCDGDAWRASDRDLVLLDEPSDLRTRSSERALQRTFDEFANAGKIVVAAMRDLHLAAYFATRVLVLDRGRVACDGRPGDVLDAADLHDRFGFPCAMLRRPAFGR